MWKLQDLESAVIWSEKERCSSKMKPRLRAEWVVKNGIRPPLDTITGPAHLLSFAKKWIAQCWHESPDKRPSIGGK